MTTIKDKTALEDHIKYLNGFQFHGFRLGLERMEAILAAIGNPEKDYPCIHVAGTNGKGSTCAFLTSILEHAGLRTGFYSSPHLYSLNERFRCGNREIEDHELAELLRRVRRYIEAGYELSYFEYTTVMAMIWFSEKKVDHAVFETGLGGRLDATNVITPEVSVITGIAVDHQAYLGHTITEIAFEKAGIIKPNRPVVCGAEPGPALEVIKERCRQMNAPLFVAGRDFGMHHDNGRLTWHGPDGHKIPDIRPGLAGKHQADNAALAIMAARLIKNRVVKDSDIRQGCRAAFWPGRGEIFKSGPHHVLLDGAHNPQGIVALNDMLDELSERDNILHAPHTLLWACSDEGGDKNFTGMLDLLSPRFGSVIITEPPGPRRPVTTEAWRDYAAAKGFLLEKNWRDAWNRAIDSTPEDGLICVAGSLYLVGSVRALLA